MRLISWNIQWARGADNVVSPGRIIDTLREMGPAQVICLQEVPQGFPELTGQCRDLVAQFSEAFPTHEAIYGPGLDVPAADGGRAHFGNLMLSALPVGQVFRHLLPFPPDFEAPRPGIQRACIEAVVTGPRGPLRLMTAHLEYYSKRQRREQVEALRNIQAEAAQSAAGPQEKAKDPIFTYRPRPLSAVLCGDFNLEPDSPEYEAMRQPAADTRWVDAWSVAHGNRAHAHTVGLRGAPWPERSFCCDYFWVSEELAPMVRSIRVNADTAASDHQPVILDLDL